MRSLFKRSKSRPRFGQEHLTERRYEAGETVPLDQMTVYSESDGLHFMLNFTVALALIIGVALWWLSRRGRVLWLQVWSIGLPAERPGFTLEMARDLETRFQELAHPFCRVSGVQARCQGHSAGLAALIDACSLIEYIGWDRALSSAPRNADFRSASSNTMLGDLPPSSRVTFFKLEEAAAFMMVRPTIVEPVKATLSISPEYRRVKDLPA